MVCTLIHLRFGAVFVDIWCIDWTSWTSQFSKAESFELSVKDLRLEKRANKVLSSVESVPVSLLFFKKVSQWIMNFALKTFSAQIVDSLLGLTLSFYN